MDEIQQPEWGYWRDHRAMELYSAVLISLDAEPRQFDASEYQRAYPEQLAEALEQRRQLAHIAVMSGRFGVPPEKPGGVFKGISMESITQFRLVDLADFAEWCIDGRLSVPPELAAMSGKSKTESIIQAVLDRDHPSFAPDLEAAVSAWIAVALEGQGNQKDTFTNRIKTWLSRNRDALSPTARNRIATVCNPLDRKR